MNNAIAFEKWATSDNRNLDVSISPVNNGYKSLATLLAWEAWQAAIEQSTALLNTCLANAKQEQAQAVPYAWHVPPMTRMYFGEYAQLDAESEAKRVGGTAKAIPLYTAPPAIDDETRKPLTDEHIDNLLVAHGKGDDGFHSFARAIEKAHGIGGEQ